MIVSAIVAIGKNREMGVDGKLPWHIPEDLAFFKEKTVGKPIIMGRKTYESIGRPLPKRTNIVVTRNTDYTAEGVVVVHSVEDALAEAQKEAPEEVMIIGGAEIYKLAWEHIDKLYITQIDATFEADTYFPEYTEFKNVLSHIEQSNGTYTYRFLEVTK